MVRGCGVFSADWIDLRDSFKSKVSKLSASVITGPLFKSFIESEDVWLCEPNKTRQMMTNWPAAEIMVMGSWERIVVGVCADTYTIELLSVVWWGNSKRWFYICNWVRPPVDGGFSQFERVTSAQRVNTVLIHFSLSAHFLSSLVHRWHNPII